MERRSRSGPRRDFGGPKPPVNQGDVLEVSIEAVGEKGDGIARKDGFVLFVPGVKEGDRVKVKVTRVLRKVGFAEVVGDAAEAPEAEESANQHTPIQEPEPEPEPEPPAEDTEDFGEDLVEEGSVKEDAEVSEEPSEEESSEENTEEAPAEEPEVPAEEEPAEDIEAPEPPKE